MCQSLILSVSRCSPPLHPLSPLLLQNITSLWTGGQLQPLICSHRLYSRITAKPTIWSALHSACEWVCTGSALLQSSKHFWLWKCYYGLSLLTAALLCLHAVRESVERGVCWGFIKITNLPGIFVWHQIHLNTLFFFIMAFLPTNVAFSPHKMCFVFKLEKKKTSLENDFISNAANTNCSFLRLSIPSLHSIIFFVHPPSSFSKPSQPHNGPPPGTVYFAPSTGSHRADLPCVHLPIDFTKILIHPSGLTGDIPVGDAHLSPLMRAPSLMKGEVGRLGVTERGRERMEL